MNRPGRPDAGYMSIEEIARREGITKDGAFKVLARAIRKLKANPQAFAVLLGAMQQCEAERHSNPPCCSIECRPEYQIYFQE